MPTLPQNIVILKNYILNPPGGGWHRYDYYQEWKRLGPYPPQQLCEEVFKLIGEELDLGHQVVDQLVDYAKDKVVDHVIEEIFEDGGALGVVIKVMKFGIYGFKWMSFQGFKCMDPPGVNHYAPDHYTDDYVEYLLWCWKYGDWKYKTPQI